MEFTVGFALGAVSMWWFMGQLGSVRLQTRDDFTALAKQVQEAVEKQVQAITKQVNENEQHVKACTDQLSKLAPNGLDKGRHEHRDL